MGAYGVSIEKKFTFRGLDERFSNVYHYRISVPTDADYPLLANAVLARDKAAYDGNVTFLTSRVFGPTEGSASANLMRLVRDETGTGTGTFSATAAYPELCYVTSIYVGRSPVKNRKVFVRKFLRAIRCWNVSDNPVSGLVTSTSQGLVNAWMNANKQVTASAVNFDMVTPKDQLVPTGNNATTLNYLHIRQIHQ